MALFVASTLHEFNQRKAMAPNSYPLSTPLRHSQSEPNLQARRRTDSGAVVRLPQLKSCSSQHHIGSKVRTEKCKESRDHLPPLSEIHRGLVRQLTPPIDRLRPSKRSRSSTSSVAAGKGCQFRCDTPAAGCLGSDLPTLSGSLSTEANNQDKDKTTGSELEQVLETALSLNTTSSACGETKEKVCFSDSDMEAHLQRLLDFDDDVQAAEKSDKIHCRKGTGFLHLKAERSVNINDERGDNENGIQRKGTGFVHLDSPAKIGKRRVKITDHHGDNENSLHRKGTGFVHLSGSSKQSCERRARISDAHGDNESSLHRKGTGFVHLNSIPKEPSSVWFPDLTGGNNNRINRKGTGFVVLNHVAPRVRIADARGDNENSIRRKGTGFVNLHDGACEVRPSSASSCGSLGSMDSLGPCRSAAYTDIATCRDRATHLCKENLSLVEVM